jgi:hypothetical protein
VLVSYRNRVDLRSIDDDHSWRFLSRLSAEKEFSVGRVKMNPYVRGELYYDSRFDTWSRVEWIGGSAFPVNRRVELEGYFDYQNDTGGGHNRQVYAIGSVLNRHDPSGHQRHAVELGSIDISPPADPFDFSMEG